MILKSNVSGSVISINEGIKILSNDGNVHSYNKIKPYPEIKIGKYVNVGDWIGTTNDNTVRYTVNKYEDYTYHYELNMKKILELNKKIYKLEKEKDNLTNNIKTLSIVFGEESRIQFMKEKLNYVLDELEKYQSELLEFK